LLKGEFLDSKKVWEQLRIMLWLLGAVLPVIRLPDMLELSSQSQPAPSHGNPTISANN
jgi:hypothetical protein